MRDCPNGCGEMEYDRFSLNVGGCWIHVYVYLCQHCQYSEAETG